MVSFLVVGGVLTLLAWIGLQITVVHGKYVVDRIADGEYEKGPFEDRKGGDSS